VVGTSGDSYYTTEIIQEIIDSNGDVVYTSDPGDNLDGSGYAALFVDQLFSFAGASLDDVNPVGAGANNPAYRFTGALLTLTTEYYNVAPPKMHHPYNGKHTTWQQLFNFDTSTWQATTFMELHSGLWSSYSGEVAVSFTNNGTAGFVNTGTGVSVEFAATGLIYSFSLSALATTVVNGIVLMGISTVIVDSVARRTHGRFEEKKYQGLEFADTDNSTAVAIEVETCDESKPQKLTNISEVMSQRNLEARTQKQATKPPRIRRKPEMKILLRNGTTSPDASKVVQIVQL